MFFESHRRLGNRDNRGAASLSGKPEGPEFPSQVAGPWVRVVQVKELLSDRQTSARGTRN